MRITAYADPRQALTDAVARVEGETLAGLSRWLGMPDDYLSRFVRGRVPALRPSVRQQLARYFGMDERDLGAPNEPTAAERERRGRR